MYKLKIKDVYLPSLLDLIRICPPEVVKPFFDLYSELGGKDCDGDVVSVIVREPCDKEDLYEDSHQVLKGE